MLGTFCLSGASAAIIHLSQDALGKGIEIAIPLATSCIIGQQSVNSQLIRQCCRAPDERLTGPSLVQLRMAQVEEGDERGRHVIEALTVNNGNSCTLHKAWGNIGCGDLALPNNCVSRATA